MAESQTNKRRQTSILLVGGKDVLLYIQTCNGDVEWIRSSITERVAGNTDVDASVIKRDGVKDERPVTEHTEL